MRKVIALRDYGEPTDKKDYRDQEVELYQSVPKPYKYRRMFPELLIGTSREDGLTSTEHRCAEEEIRRRNGQ